VQFLFGDAWNADGLSRRDGEQTCRLIIKLVEIRRLVVHPLGIVHGTERFDILPTIVGQDKRFSLHHAAFLVILFLHR